MSNQRDFVTSGFTESGPDAIVKGEPVGVALMEGDRPGVVRRGLRPGGGPSLAWFLRFEDGGTHAAGRSCAALAESLPLKEFR